MAHRARYVGSAPAIFVPLPNGKRIVVERGKWLPEEVDGEKVPASLRDELLAREGEWTSVEPSKDKE